MANSIDGIILRRGPEQGADNISYSVYDVITKDSRKTELSYADSQVNVINTSQGSAYVVTTGYTHRTTQKIEAVGVFSYTERDKAFETALQKARVIATERAQSIGVPLQDEILIKEQRYSKIGRGRPAPIRPPEGALSGADDIGRA